MQRPDPHKDPVYARALRDNAALNLVMFFVEGAVGLAIGSAALIADAADFLEDAGGYGLALVATNWSRRGRAWVGVFQALMMGGVGAVAVWQIAERLIEGGAPAPEPLAGVAVLALAANLYCASRLVRFKRGDSSMRAIWLSTRNDAVLNLCVIASAGLIVVTGSGWPDIAAGCLIASLNLWAAGEVLLRGIRELRT